MDKFWTTEEVASMLRVNGSTVRRWRLDDVGPCSSRSATCTATRTQCCRGGSGSGSTAGGQRERGGPATRRGRARGHPGKGAAQRDPVHGSGAVDPPGYLPP